MLQNTKYLLRPVEILVGLRTIAKRFGVSKDTLRTWEENGAPIVRDEKGTARCEAGELWIWYRRDMRQCGY